MLAKHLVYIERILEINMDFDTYYKKNKTYITYEDYRLNKIIEVVVDAQPSRILDIGCGSGFLLDRLSEKLKKTKLVGVDVYPLKKNNRWAYKEADITHNLPYSKGSFDCVILGEVIEHVPDPDYILKEINRILVPKGMLIISTPNLVSWANRLLVLFGIQPLFTETSSEKNLGRVFKVLGQGGKVQGHLKIFTSRSLEEILIKEKFKITRKMGIPFFFPFPVSIIDRFFVNFISLASGTMYITQKKGK